MGPVVVDEEPLISRIVRGFSFFDDLLADAVLLAVLARRVAGLPLFLVVAGFDKETSPPQKNQKILTIIC